MKQTGQSANMKFGLIPTRDDKTHFPSAPLFGNEKNRKPNDLRSEKMVFRNQEVPRSNCA